MANRRFTERVSALALALTLSAAAQNSITPSQARDHIGERTTVCGAVASTHYASSSRGNPTFINLDRPYPDQVFTVLIWGSDRPRFGQPDQSLRAKHVCVTGTISSYKGVPEIVVQTPSQISVE
jgi:hypothetical protein